VTCQVPDSQCTGGGRKGSVEPVGVLGGGRVDGGRMVKGGPGLETDMDDLVGIGFVGYSWDPFLSLIYLKKGSWIQGRNRLNGGAMVRVTRRVDPGN
jgi:hypothetical protein